MKASFSLFLLASLLIQNAAWAGLPSVYGELPHGIRNPRGYALIASMDDSNQHVSTSEVYFVPIQQSMALSGQNWSALILDGAGHRGGYCEAIEQATRTLNQMETRLSHLEDDTIPTTGSYMTLGRYRFDVGSAERAVETACTTEESSTCRLARERLARATSALESAHTEAGRLATRIEQRRAAITRDYGSIHGGNITGIWNDGYQDAKRRIESDNPGILVKRLPQRQINIYVGGALRTGSMPGVLAESHSGIVMPAGSLDSHPMIIPESGSNATTAEGEGFFSLLQATPFSVSDTSDAGNVGAFTLELSAVGACGMLEQIESRTSTSAVTIVSSSVFPSTARTQVRASYHLWRIFEKVRTIGVARSGFLGLNRQAYDRVVESMRDGEDYSFEFISESPVDAAMASRWRETLKRELLDRVLAATFEVTRDVNTPAIPEPGRLPFNRAVEVGGLGRVIMGIGPLGGFFSGARALVGSIEGSASAEGSVRSSWDRMVTETWAYNRILPMISTVAIEVIPAR